MSILHPDVVAIAKQIVEQKYANGQLSNIFMLGKLYTPDDQINEVRNGTPVGEEIMLAHYRASEYLKSKL